MMIKSTTLILQLLLLVLLSCCGSSLSTPNASSKKQQKVAVIGATGRLGRQAVEQLSARGIPCALLLRNYNNNKDTATTTPPPTSLTKDSSKADVIAYLTSLPNVETIVQGDVSNTAALTTLLSDCTACLALFGATRRSQLSDIWTNPSDNDGSHAKAINYQGVANILEAAKASKTCKRIVRITGKGETPYSFFSILINLLGGMAKAWNYEGEQLLRNQAAAAAAAAAVAVASADSIDYTIVRPGIMSEEGPKDDNYSLVLGDDGADLKVAAIQYADVATLCIDCLDYPNAARSTLTVMTEPRQGEAEQPSTQKSSFATLLQTVQADRRTFPTDMLQQHQQAVRKTLAGLGVVSVLFLSVVVRFVMMSFFAGA